MASIVEKFSRLWRKSVSDKEVQTIENKASEVIINDEENSREINNISENNSHEICSENNSSEISDISGDVPIESEINHIEVNGEPSVVAIKIEDGENDGTVVEVKQQVEKCVIVQRRSTRAPKKRLSNFKPGPLFTRMLTPRSSEFLRVLTIRTKNDVVKLQIMQSIIEEKLADIVKQQNAHNGGNRRKKNKVM